MRASRKQLAKFQTNLNGGLPFPTPEGRKRPARPLTVSRGALSPAQAKSESSHQQSAVMWFKDWQRVEPRFARTFHVANEFDAKDKVEKVDRITGETYWSSASASRRKAEGVKPGIFDFLNLGVARGFSGLAIDLKVRSGDLTNDPEAKWDQVRERAWLISQNKSTHTAWSWAEVAALHAWYFEVTNAELRRSIGRLDMWLISKGGHDKRCGCGQVNLESFLNGG